MAATAGVLRALTDLPVHLVSLSATDIDVTVVVDDGERVHVSADAGRWTSTRVIVTYRDDRTDTATAREWWSR